MSFLRCAVVALVCFAGVLAGVNASGFSAQFAPPAPISLSNGANSVLYTTPNGNSAWVTSASSGGFTDGQFQADGAYTIPVNGAYHFDATLTVTVGSSSAPLEPVDLRIVRCVSASCNALCTGSPYVAATLINSGTNFLTTGTANIVAQPTYSLSASFTGYFNTGDIIGLCVDSSAFSGAVSLACSNAARPNSCSFSGFSV